MKNNKPKKTEKLYSYLLLAIPMDRRLPEARSVTVMMKKINVSSPSPGSHSEIRYKIYTRGMKLKKKGNGKFIDNKIRKTMSA